MQDFRIKVQVWQHERSFWIVFTDTESDVMIIIKPISQPEAQLLIQGGIQRVKDSQPLTPT